MAGRLPRRWRAALAAAMLAAASLAQAVDPSPAVQVAPAPLGFDAALQQALTLDGALRVARGNLDALRAQQAQLRSRLFPSAGFSATQGRSSDEELGAPVSRRVQRSEGFLRWNLYNGGADQLALQAITRDVAAAEAELRQALEEACERLAKAYVELGRQQAQRVHAERRLQAVGELVQRVDRQVAAGKAADADGRLAQASLIDARLALDGVQADLASARAQLAVLTGVDAAGLEVARWQAPRVADPALPLDEWWSRALAGHPQVAALAARRDAAQARVPQVAPEYLPRLDLELRKTLSDRTAPQNSSVERRAWSLGLSYEVPLGGAAGARRDEARARAQAADGDWFRGLQSVRGELAAVREQALQFGAALPGLERQHEQLALVVRASDLQYQAGRRGLQQLIDQQDRLYGSAQRGVDTEARLALATLRLAALTGSLASALGVAAVEGMRVDDDAAAAR